MKSKTRIEEDIKIEDRVLNPEDIVAVIKEILD